MIHLQHNLLDHTLFINNDVYFIYLNFEPVFFYDTLLSDCMMYDIDYSAVKTSIANQYQTYV
jgi:hypothetical protein